MRCRAWRNLLRDTCANMENKAATESDAPSSSTGAVVPKVPRWRAVCATQAKLTETLICCHHEHWVICRCRWRAAGAPRLS